MEENKTYLALGQSDLHGRPYTVRAIIPGDTVTQARLLKAAYTQLGEVQATSLQEAQIAAWLTYVTQDDNAQLRWTRSEG